jgi:predicted RNA binding protein YcfA (HicA-like mRNA interferase family)
MRKESWDQIRNVTADELIRALDRDKGTGWYRDETGSSAVVYRNDLIAKIVSIHRHSHKTFSPRQLREILEDIGWSDEDLKRLKLIK